MDPPPIELLAQDGRHLPLIVQGAVDVVASQKITIAPIQRFGLLPFGRARQSRHHLRPFVIFRSSLSTTQRHNLARSRWPVKFHPFLRE